MRSADRLCQVLRSLNREWFGYGLVEFMNEAANNIEGGYPFPRGMRLEMQHISTTAASPHLKELANEALALEPRP